MDLPGQHPSNAFVDILEQFLESEHKAVKLYGIKEALQELASEMNLPIKVLQHRGTIYLKRTDTDA